MFLLWMKLWLNMATMPINFWATKILSKQDDIPVKKAARKKDK